MVGVKPPFDLEHLRETFRAAVDRPEDGDRTPACVDDDRMWAAAIGDLDAESVRAIVDHVAGCPRCAESWRVAISMAEPLAHDSRTGRRPGVATWVSLAVAATLVAAVGYVMRPRPPGNPEAAFRSGADRAIESRVTDPRLPREQFVLRWTPGPAGTTYSASVTDQQGRTLYEIRDLQQPECTVPASSLAQLPPNSRVFWRVDANLADGTKVTSRNFDVILR
jgi:hypothetical protein